MLTEYRTSDQKSEVKQGAITVILSGDRPVEMLRQEAHRYAFIDGRLEDLKDPSHFDTGLIPLVSDDYSRAFGWNGQGEMPADQRAKLADICSRAHAAHTMFRLWATPDRLEIWQTLYDAGVDLLNADDLPGLGTFLRSKL